MKFEFKSVCYFDMTMTLRFKRKKNMMFYFKLLWVTTFVHTTFCFPSSGPDLDWIVNSKMMHFPGKINLKDGAQIFEICINSRIFLDKNISSYIHLEVKIETSLNATDVSSKPTITYAMMGFAGVSVIVLYIGIIMAKTRHEGINVIAEIMIFYAYKPAQCRKLASYVSCEEG
ncbi:uncharacterized protein LOC132747587 [Ruditapes philippinarum]|uniref:uncharacterized protein LOC132747587 n=1 Tax=Ruditapes philippinarum TaxID=129788 RepID=UPI00295BA788|nr:uncharacterized protein LOC132747587 [Ruditapes philippinarum]